MNLQFFMQLCTAGQTPYQSLKRNYSLCTIQILYLHPPPKKKNFAENVNNHLKR